MLTGLAFVWNNLFICPVLFSKHIRMQISSGKSDGTFKVAELHHLMVTVWQSVLCYTDG